MIDLTPTIVQDFYTDILKEYKAYTKNKDDSSFMQTCAWWLHQLKITDKETFMKEFTTTIGSTIYIPFEIGVESNYSLLDQVDIVIHEIHHVLQDRNDPLFKIKYIGSKSERTNYEAEAYSADMEFYIWRTGTCFDIDKRASVLKHYGVDQEHVDYLAEYLRSVLDLAEQGIVKSSVVSWAIDWFTQRENDATA